MIGKNYLLIVSCLKHDKKYFKIFFQFTYVYRKISKLFTLDDIQ